MTGINTQILIFMQDVKQMIKASNLPPVVVGLALDNIRAQVATMETKALSDENSGKGDEKNESTG